MMLLRPKMLLLLVIFCTIGKVAKGQTILNIPPGLESVAVGSTMELMEDPSGALSLDEVQASAAWHPTGSGSFNVGFSRSAWWMRITLYNAAQEKRVLFLDTQSTLADYLDFYAVESGITRSAIATGDRRPFDTRPLHSRTFVFPLELEAGATLTLYMRQYTHDGLHEVLAPVLWSADYFQHRVQNESTLLGFFYGSGAVILVYCLFLYWSARELDVLYYLVYMLMFIGWSVVFRGYSFQYLIPENPHLNNQLLAVFSSFGVVLFFHFVTVFLDIRNAIGRTWYWLFRLWMLAAIIPTLLALADHYALVFGLQFIIGISFVVMSMVVAVVLAFRKSRAAVYYLLGFSWFLAGVVIYTLSVSGLIEATEFTEYAIQVGSLLDLLILGLGLVDRINELKLEKQSAEREVLESKARLAEGLEKEVKERTAQLERVNQQLAEKSIRDELTGIYNRRHFNELFHQALALRNRQSIQFALCIMDLDHFKELNDRCGHQVGDEVLQQVTACLQDHLKRANDHIFRLGDVFRVGGEEFALLLNINGPITRCLEFVDTICAAVKALGIAHPGNPDAGVVTASFGLLMIKADSPGQSMDSVYRKADELLYLAKRQGRNRVVHSVI